jgi:hypothetical protein
LIACGGVRFRYKDRAFSKKGLIWFKHIPGLTWFKHIHDLTWFKNIPGFSWPGSTPFRITPR